MRRIRLISAVLTAALASLAAMALRASASLTGEYTKFQHCPFSESEIDLSVETTVRGRTRDNQVTFSQQVRKLFKTLFIGLNCYVGSITNTVRRAITLKSTSQADQIGNALTTTRTNALRRLTFSPA